MVALSSRRGLFGAPMRPAGDFVQDERASAFTPGGAIPMFDYRTPGIAPDQQEMDQRSSNTAPPMQSPGVPPMADQGSIGFDRAPSAALDVPAATAGLPSQLAGSTTRQPKFFEHRGAGEKILQGLGDFALNYAASQGDPSAIATLQNRMSQQRQTADWQRQDAQRAQDRSWQVEDRDAKIKAPQYFMSGRDRVQFDPTNGESNVVYDGPEDYQNYAQAVGLDPGDDGYNGAVQDYVLRGNGPTSNAARRSLETDRQQNRLTLKATPTYANLNPRPAGGGRHSGGATSGGAPKTMAAVFAPIMAKVAAGKQLTPAEQQAYSMYRPGRGGGGRTGTSPTTGLPVVNTPADAARLPRGTRFQTPDGRVKMVP